MAVYLTRADGWFASHARQGGTPGRFGPEGLLRNILVDLVDVVDWVDLVDVH